MHAIDIFMQDRQLIRAALIGLSEDAYLQIPPGYDNNIAWNLGHIVVTQQALHYRLCGLPTVTTREDIAMFKTGSSPADWREVPDISRLLVLLEETAPQLQADYDAGRLASFKPYTTSTGIALSSIEDALSFNNFHEGLHLGAILALRNLVDGA
ncbi:MAG: DinB family protein [Candidatus Promineifilaceae bacterium]|jgi:DinB superfamily